MTRKVRNQYLSVVEEVHLYNILTDSREIFIHGDYGSEEDSGTDFRMATRFLKNIRLLETVNKEPIIIHQHNLGGYWDSGVVMYDSILISPCMIVFIIHGNASSMGSIIPQAADLRLISANATLMIHQGSTDIEGMTYKQSQSWAIMEKKQTDQMIDIYVKKCINGPYFKKLKADEKRVKKFILSKMNEKEDWWILPDEAVDFGFVDGIYGEGKYENIDIIKEGLKSE